ncbi:PfkB family carbohydrate kinase [Streptomyces sp. NPDC051776]|uniref:PfkB family carbohydrate kinase n=1 Tax=Streptomyces sp. NPDC051776 TaxID=3155414 RepID=UPI0034209943
MAELLEACRARTIVIRRVDDGATAVTDGARWTRRPFEVPLADPAGAGDAFAAGYPSGRLRGLPGPEAPAEAACVAALVAQGPVDTDGLPTTAARDRALTAFTESGDSVHR